MNAPTQFVDPRITEGFNQDSDRDKTGNLQRLKDRWLTEQPMLDFKPELKKHGIINAGTCDTICNTIFFNQQFRQKGKNKDVEIGCDSWLKSIAHGDLKKARNKLLEKELIHCDNHKKYGDHGSKAFYYRFTNKGWEIVKQLRKNPPKLTKCNINKRHKRVEKQREEKYDPEEAELLDCMADYQFKIKIKDIDGLTRLWDEIKVTSTTVAITVFESSITFIFRELLEKNIILKANRYYCALNRLPKDLRKFFGHEDGKELISLDIGSCYPTFLFGCYKDETEEERNEMGRYIKWLDHDFYRTLLTNVRRYYKNTEKLKQRIPKTRDEVKTDFNASLNSVEWERDKIRKSKITNFDHKFSLTWYVFIKNFPLLFERLVDEINDNKALYISKKNRLCAGIGLTAVELKVMRPVYKALMRRNIWFNPAHDGVTVEKDGYLLAKRFIEEQLLKVIGYARVTAETWIDEKPLTFTYNDDTIKDDPSKSLGEPLNDNLYIEGVPCPYYGGFLDDVPISSTVVE
jgi:hypothetical protein